MAQYPTGKYGDVVLDYGGGRIGRISQAMIPGNGFIPKEMGIYLTQGAVRAFGKQLFLNIQDEWQAHTVTGGSLRAMELQMGAMTVTIKLAQPEGYTANPFLLVEGGFAAHDISVHDPQSALHWDTDAYAKTVHNPGYQGDPYIERAMDNLSYDKIFMNLAVNALKATGPSLQSIALSLGGSFQWENASANT